MVYNGQQAHTLTPLLTESNPPSFPFLTLLVSGGHTQIVLASSQSLFKILADTRDSSIGYVYALVGMEVARLTLLRSVTASTRSRDCSDVTGRLDRIALPGLLSNIWPPPALGLLFL